MRRMLTVSTLMLMLLAGTVGAQSDPVQFEIYSYSYFTPPEQVGTVVTVVGKLEPPVGFTYPLPLDFVTNEYTFYFQSTIIDVQVEPVTTTYTYDDADFLIYEDPSQNADYGTNPPNGTCPSTFTDGTLILQGTLSSLTRIDYNFGFPGPSVVADCTFNGGSRLGELPSASDWTFHGGLSSDPGLGIPTGFQRNWATKIVYSGQVPTGASTWGGIKALYGTD